jgi:dTDP-4-amino-4,6-dideoxygalactose transaminase
VTSTIIADSTAPVPFGDLRREAVELGDELHAAVDNVLSRGQFILGPEVAAFEEEFASLCETPHAVAVASGTDALTLSLAALEPGPGAEVITTTLTSGATITAIVRAACVPVFVDVDPKTLLIDVEAVSAAQSSRTLAIVPVHLFGAPVDLGRLQEVTNGLPVIEDACQAHGAFCGDRPVGGVGLAGCFSFYPSKNLGAYGDGGMVVTSDANLAERLKALRQYGWRQRDSSELLGFNSRLDELQAAVLRVKLPLLGRWNARRRALAGRYRRWLGGSPTVGLLREVEGEVNHLFVLRVAQRDRVREGLAALGIATGIHYPVPLHRQPAFARWARNRDFPVADAACAEVLSLPMFAQLSDEEADRAARAVLTVVSTAA